MPNRILTRMAPSHTPYTAFSAESSSSATGFIMVNNDDEIRGDKYQEGATVSYRNTEFLRRKSCSRCPSMRFLDSTCCAYCVFYHLVEGPLTLFDFLLYAIFLPWSPASTTSPNSWPIRYPHRSKPANPPGTNRSRRCIYIRGSRPNDPQTSLQGPD